MNGKRYKIASYTKQKFLKTYLVKVLKLLIDASIFQKLAKSVLKT